MIEQRAEEKAKSPWWFANILDALSSVIHSATLRSHTSRQVSRLFWWGAPLAVARRPFLPHSHGEAGGAQRPISSPPVSLVRPLFLLFPDTTTSAQHGEFR